MMITVTDEGMPPHVYDSECKCRGCVAVKKAKNRAWGFTFVAVVIGATIFGFFFGDVLGGLLGIVIAAFAAGTYAAFSPKSEVLMPD